jgi:hypothetical protein
MPEASTDLVLPSTDASLINGSAADEGDLIQVQPRRTVASLIAEVIARSRSPQTKRAYAGDLDDFLTWWLGKVDQPYQTRSVRANSDEMTADAILAAHLDSTLQALQLVTEGQIQQYLDHLEGWQQPGAPPAHASATLNRRLTPLCLPVGFVLVGPLLTVCHSVRSFWVGAGSLGARPRRFPATRRRPRRPAVAPAGAACRGCSRLPVPAVGLDAVRMAPVFGV